MFPEIFISNEIVIPTYLAYLSLLYCLLIYLVYRKAIHQLRPVQTALDLAFIMMVAGFIGGRSLHVIFEAPIYYQEDWLRVFYFWQGGFVYYGGFFLAIFCAAIYLLIPKKKKGYRPYSFLDWADFFTPIISLGYALGRISCFLAGCCHGLPCDLPWAVVFPWDQNLTPRHPVQLYMVFLEFGILATLLLISRISRLKTGSLFYLWLGLHGLARLATEQFRDDFRGNLILNLSLGTWISFVLIVVAIFGLSVQGLTSQTKTKQSRPSQK